MTRRWLRRHESLMDWMGAWFGGSAVTAFQLHDPGGLGWIYTALAGAALGAMIMAHSLNGGPA